MYRIYSKKAQGFTLIEIMIVVLIIGILLAIAIPNFVQARKSARAKSCVGNLKQIDSAKQQCAMDNKLKSGDTTATFDITGAGTASATNFLLIDKTGATGYLRSVPSCPSSGSYTVGVVAVAPSCDISAGVASGDYASGGKYYHGLN